MKLRHEPMRFTNRSLALSFAEECEGIRHAVIIGDDNRFWVVCMADFARLLKAGYQAA